MMLTAKDWLEKIRALPLARRVRIMNVCGGHERSITMAGLRGALPSSPRRAQSLLRRMKISGAMRINTGDEKWANAKLLIWHCN